MPAPRELLTLDAYRAEVAALVTGPTQTERVSLDDALDRVLAEDVTAAGPVPAFANSAMDGYAVRWDDLASLPARLTVVGEVAAGSGEDPAISPGECVRIMTGAPVPEAADSVVPVEQTDEGVDVVRVHEAPSRGRGSHVRRAGEDVATGDVVLRSGTALTPGALSAAAGAGRGELVVRRRPVIGVAATGDELVPPGRALGRGQIYESNTTHLRHAARRLGADVIVGAAVPDDTGAFAAALDDLAARADLVVLTGGASVGAHDVARDVLTERAGAAYRHVRIQPGKPQGWARWQGTPVISLPGNPVSAAISFELFVRPLVDALLGRDGPAAEHAVAASGWTSPEGRRQLVPVALSSDQAGRLLATPTHSRGSASHMVTSLAGAHALAEVPEDVVAVEPGDVLTIRRFA